MRWAEVCTFISDGRMPWRVPLDVSPCFWTVQVLLNVQKQRRLWRTDASLVHSVFFNSQDENGRLPTGTSLKHLNFVPISESLIYECIFLGWKRCRIRVFIYILLIFKLFWLVKNLYFKNQAKSLSAYVS